jgi:MoaA/NifB/PqqE/SkfB family radical SAM enzyme
MMLYVGERMAKRGGDMGIYTNGVAFDEEAYRRLLELGTLKFFSMSLNAGSEEGRMRAMKLPLSGSFNNLKRALEIREEVGKVEQCHICSSMMLCPQNWMEEPLFKAKVGMLFKPYKNVEGGNIFHATNWNGKVKNYWMVRHPGPEIGGYCTQWLSPAPHVNVDGEIYHCCYTAKWSYGNVLDRESAYRWMIKNLVAKVDSTKPETFPLETCSECSHKYTLDLKDNRWPPCRSATE